MLLNVDSFRLSIDVNGPGRRIILWLQGCTLGCKGCFNQHLLPHKPNKLIEINELAMTILENLKKFEAEGVTLSGGEPFQQAKGCYQLIKKLKKEGFNSVVYTGYTLEELSESKNPSVEKLMKLSDILIAGRYNGNSSLIRTWNNNPDKKLQFNSKNVKGNNNKQSIEFFVSKDSLLVTGFPSKNDFRNLQNQAKKQSIVLD